MRFAFRPRWLLGFAIAALCALPGLVANDAVSTSRDPSAAADSPAIHSTTFDGETCETAIDIGTFPPDYSESGVLDAFGEAWRRFTLESFRNLKPEVVSSPANVYAFVRSGCVNSPHAWRASSSDFSPPQCVGPGVYSMGIASNNPDSAAYTLALRDYGPCFLSRKLFVRPYRITDLDGDHDGFADTGETVELSLKVANVSDWAYTNLRATVSTNDPRIECIGSTVVTFGPVPAHGEAESTSTLRFRVSPSADRGAAGVSPHDSFLAEFDAMLSATEIPVLVPAGFSLDLDLNSSTAVAPTTTYVEGFESATVNFVFESLDTNKASNSASDGFRCQYNDPDFVHSNSYGETECYLGFSIAGNINDWHRHTTSAPDHGRAYAGTGSMHFGRHTPNQPDLDTYDLSQLDAVRIGNPGIYLAARICRDDPSPGRRACNADVDCLPVGGGPCVSAAPQLSFKHQVSAVDWRCQHAEFLETVDRAVVLVRTVNGTVWKKLEPYRNIYHAQATTFSNCTFDPTDDGNDEDDYFDPADPQRRYGPSSTCRPEFVFADIGETSQSFSPSNTGWASDGPGLPGSLGLGTWVESRFDLSAYRGRSIRIRFLFATIKVADQLSLESTFMWNPTPCDDGWYIDDVQVTETLGSVSPTAKLDDAVPPVPSDTDGDAAVDGCDCAPADSGAFALALEVTGLRFEPDKITLAWDPAQAGAGSATVHDVVRGILSQLPVGSGAGEVCLVPGLPAAGTADPATPTAGSGYWYLVRGKNSCGRGSFGVATSGVERTISVCP